MIGVVHGLLKSMYTMFFLQSDVHDEKRNDYNMNSKSEIYNAFFTLCLMPYLPSYNNKNISHNTNALEKQTPRKHKTNETKQKGKKEVHLSQDDNNNCNEENDQAARQLKLYQ